jgi:hypothetical protein
VVSHHDPSGSFAAAKRQGAAKDKSLPRKMCLRLRHSFNKVKVWLTRFSEVLHLPGWRNGLGTALAFCLTVLAAHLSYTIYERPFLRLKKRFTFVPSRD